MSERRKSGRKPHPNEKFNHARETEELNRPTGTWAEITLDLVARTAIELQKLFPNEVALDGDTLGPRGQQAIELLSIWKRQLEIEKRTGAAAKNAEAVLRRWDVEREEERKNHEELEREARQRAEWAKIPRTRQIPLAKAARMIFPRKREPTKLLEEILKILVEERSPLREPITDSCRKALKYKSIPEGLIPELKTIQDTILKRYESRIAKLAGRMGGLQRAQKYSRNKTAAKHDEK
jgi:hypothetical protein